MSRFNIFRFLGFTESPTHNEILRIHKYQLIGVLCGILMCFVTLYKCMFNKNDHIPQIKMNTNFNEKKDNSNNNNIDNSPIIIGDSNKIEIQNNFK